MPPKGGGGGKGPSQKTIAKKKEKLIEDKTFGLKNKNKSKKVQKYVAEVTKQVHNAGRGKPVRVGDMPPKSKAEQERDRLAELNTLFKPVQAQTVPQGVDPKTVLCQYFAKGTCGKGDKCKFSHDKDIGRKAAKIDLYTDKRGDQAPAESMGPCNHFLDALEQKKFGFFWECPNGNKCPQLHCLPKGVILKDDKPIDPALLTDDDETPLEQLLEEERRKLQGKGTPVTLERFLAWRERKQREKEGKEGAAAAASAQASESTHSLQNKAARKALSGRQMFAYRPELFVDDDDAADETAYEHSEDAPDPDVPINIIEVTGTSLTRTAVNAAAGALPSDEICWEPITPSLWKDIPLPPELRVK